MWNNRLKSIEEYHFKNLDSIKEKALKDGINIVDLSIGDPDLSVHKNILDGLVNAFEFKGYNQYPPYDGIKELKLQIIKYYEEVYSVKLNLDEVLILIGSKEGINNIIPAVCDFGDVVISPVPGYPVYSRCSNLWGCRSYKIPLKSKDNYLPDIKNIPEDISEKSKLFFINYPNNPTGAVANEVFLKDIINYCNKNDIILCNDAAYNEIIEENKLPISLLQYDNKKSCIEFGSLSKTYNMTGFRIGYAVGNSKVISALLKIKSNVDSGQFKPIQWAAVEALKLDRGYINIARRIIDDRRSTTQKILKEHGIEYFEGKGTFYIWCKVPKNYTVDEFCSEIFKEVGILVTPGYAFGDLCCDNFRIALTKEIQIIKSAFGQIRKYN